MTRSEHEATPPEERILWAAAGLLRKGGAEVFSLQAVAGAAGVRPAVICGHFGDRDGLLDALVSFLLQGHLDEKRRIVLHRGGPCGAAASALGLARRLRIDPAQQLRPRLRSSAGRKAPIGSRRGDCSADCGNQATRRTGSSTMSVERAIIYFRSSGAGFILTQMSLPPSERDPELSSIIFESTVAAMTGDAKAQGLSRSGSAGDLADHAIALQKALRQKGSPALTPAQLNPLFEFLNRVGRDHP